MGLKYNTLTTLPTPIPSTAVKRRSRFKWNCRKFVYREIIAQGIRLLMADGSRVVFRLSGTGSSGATVRMYVDTYVNDPAKIELPAKELLAPLINVSILVRLFANDSCLVRAYHRQARALHRTHSTNCYYMRETFVCHLCTIHTLCDNCCQ